MSLINFGSNNFDAGGTAIAQVEQSNATRFAQGSFTPFEADVIGNLLPCTWRGQNFPITDLKTSLSHDLAVHKYPNLDSALIEDMGRNPIVTKATIVFVNSIEPGPSETWTTGSLYPQGLATFLSNCYDSSLGIGTLQHPFLGNIQCYLHSVDQHLDARFRGGEVVEATWIESLVLTSGGNTTNTQASLNNLAARTTASASQVDNAFVNLNPNPASFGLTAPSTDFFTQVTQMVQSVSGTASLTALQGIGIANRVISQCKTIINTCDSQNNIQLAQVKAAATQLRANAIEFANNPTSTNFGYYIVPSKMTLTFIAQVLNVSITSLLSLNPLFTSSPTVPEGSVIKYTPGT